MSIEELPSSDREGIVLRGPLEERIPTPILRHVKLRKFKALQMFILKVMILKKMPTFKKIVTDSESIEPSNKMKRLLKYNGPFGCLPVHMLNQNL